MIHPSYLGNIDLLVCGNSDPGTSGLLTPFGKINGLYFSNSHEPDGFMFNFKQDVSKLMESENVEYIEIKAECKEDYYKILDELSEFTEKSLKISGTSKDPLNIIIEKPVDLDSDDKKDKEDLE